MEYAHQRDYVNVSIIGKVQIVQIKIVNLVALKKESAIKDNAIVLLDGLEKGVNLNHA
jgi:hypothetical protein